MVYMAHSDSDLYAASTQSHNFQEIHRDRIEVERDVPFKPNRKRHSQCPVPCLVRS